MQPGRPLVSTTTRLYGIFAHATGQRPMVVSVFFNELLDRHGVDAMFIPLQVSPEHLAAVLAGMRHLRDFAGFCVTMPHKAAVAELCDELLPNARACGVVNVVRIDPGGRLIGETFDGVGMVHAIASHRTLDVATRVLLVGAGGVGRAIAVALALAGVGHLAITNRTRARADALAQTVRRAAPACAVEAGAAFDPARFDIVINATSLGTGGQGPMPIEVSRISGTALVADVVAAPEYTPLLQAAQARGLTVVRGLEMMTPQIDLAADFLGMTSPASAPSGAGTEQGLVAGKTGGGTHGASV
jgi:shikimate dehydrogenase